MCIATTPLNGSNHIVPSSQPSLPIIFAPFRGGALIVFHYTELYTKFDAENLIGKFGIKLTERDINKFSGNSQIGQSLTAKQIIKCIHHQPQIQKRAINTPAARMFHSDFSAKYVSDTNLAKYNLIDKPNDDDIEKYQQFLGAFSVRKTNESSQGGFTDELKMMITQRSVVKGAM
jgi:hypothetical protein